MISGTSIKKDKLATEWCVWVCVWCMHASEMSSVEPLYIYTYIIFTEAFCIVYCENMLCKVIKNCEIQINIRRDPTLLRFLIFIVLSNNIDVTIHRVPNYTLIQINMS